MPPASCCALQCSSQQRSQQTASCPHHFCSTWVSGRVPSCSTAQARAGFLLGQQLPGCHPPTTQPYLKMHLCSQQLLVELRVLQDMVAMANALSLQEINCLENTGKPRTASEHQLTSLLPAQRSLPTTGTAHTTESAPGKSFFEPPGPHLCLGPQCLLCYEYREDLGSSLPGAGDAGAIPTPAPLFALSQELLVPP